MASDRDGNDHFWSKVEHAELPHCGQCDRTRHVEGADGRLTRCPTCHPLALEVIPQARPGPASPPLGPVRGDGADAAAEARRMLENRPRPDKRAGQAAAPAALTGAALARRQAAEARAARPTDPPDGQPPDGDYPF